MAWYAEDYRWYPEEYGRGARRRWPSREGRYGARADYGWSGYGYGGELGYGTEYRPGAEARYGAEYYRQLRFGRMPHRPARGYPVRGYHSYDLDYGRLAGPTTDYSGRAGYTEDRDWVEAPRGPYSPRLTDIGRESRRRRLYERREWPYSGPGRPAWGSP